MTTDVTADPKIDHDPEASNPIAASGQSATPPGGSNAPLPGSDYPDRRSAFGAIARLVLVVSLIVAIFLAAHLGALLIVIVSILVVVALHELGHFATAKWSHMKVTEFFIGFGPRLWSVRRGETDYGIKPIPAGAYVKIPGMTNLDQVDPADEARTYRQQPFGNRVLVASAGSIMHFLIALVLAWIAVVAFGTPSGANVRVTGFVKWPGHAETAAQAAGLRVGDRIVAVDGKTITKVTTLSKTIQASKGAPVTLVVDRDGQDVKLTVTPQAGHRTKDTQEVIGPGPGKTDWLIGIENTGLEIFSPEGPIRGIGTAVNTIGRMTAETVTGVGHAFSPSGLHSLYNQLSNPQAAKAAAANPAANDRVSSIVGAAHVATQAEQAGVYYLIEVLIVLNIGFGLLNMLPMLPLDGGHVAIALYERIRTRKGKPYYQADVAKLLPVAYAFMAFLVLFVGAALFLDIAHPAANPFG